MKFINMLNSSLEIKNSHVCVGLDSRYDRIPALIKQNLSVSKAILSFNRHIIEVTHDIAVAYKMNLACYSGFGLEGFKGLQLTNKYLQDAYPNIPRLADYKRSEIGDSVDLMAKEVFDWLGFTCMMVDPWFGKDTVNDLLEKDEHGVCVYVHDSNHTAKEFQELELKDGSFLFEKVAKRVTGIWNWNGNVFVESGSTYPNALIRVREIVGDNMPILTSGIGAQGGKIKDLKGAFGKNGQRLFVNSSRGIIFAGEGKKDYFAAVRLAADTLRVEILKQSIS